MREISFRGKTQSGGVWIYGNLISWKKGICKIAKEIEDESMDLYNVEPETVGQCTGVVDKKGKAIFEGDIITYRNGKAVVAYFHSRVCFGAKLSDTEAYAIMPEDIEDAEVLGNIYDNPELL